MATDKPLLILPAPGPPIQRKKKNSGFGNIGKPGRERQTERIEPKFKVLEKAFEDRKTRLLTEAAGITPEEVLVLETAGAVDDFFVAVRNIEGMDWLGEIEEEDIPPDDDFFAVDKKGQRKPDKTLRGRVFLVFSNHQAFQQLLSLWEMWQKKQPFPTGKAKWKQLFENLRDVRPWGVKDRLFETGVLEDWKDRIQHDVELLPCEIELWYRQTPEMRQVARKRVLDLVDSCNGKLIDEAIIDQIAYHALLVELPSTAISQVLDASSNDISLFQCEQIQFFRACGQMAGVIEDDTRTVDETEAQEPERKLKDPVVALLDGVPLQNHQRLAGRLIIDDPDDIESLYQANERRHGTAMASLIIHGDLEGNGNALDRYLYIQPVLEPNPLDFRRIREEVIPENKLVADVIHRAVIRIFDGIGGEPPSAPSICVINLSIGIRDRFFDGALSPLARLLDWLSWKYQVLFIVSAGNHVQPIEFDVPRGQFSKLTDQQIQELVIKTIAADARNRRLLSPAEAINVLTIGAIHDDQSKKNEVVRSLQPYADPGLPSPINAQGMGFKRSIKPDIFAAGGKVVLTESLVLTPNEKRAVYTQTRAPGQKVAAPGSFAGDLSAAWYVRGTSNATALASRAASFLYDILDDLRNEPGGEMIDTIPPAIWIKALLTHSSDWGTGKSVLETCLKTSENSRQFKEYLTRLLGYGAFDDSRVYGCTDHRVTALSGGVIKNDQADVHRFPLPPSLSGQRGWRRLTITLAWFTPINPAHQSWRRSSLWFEPPKEALKVKRQQADWRAAKRGTVQHEILEGNSAAAFIDDDLLEVQVNCTADAGTLEEEIPYALVTTLEVAEDIEIEIYNDVRVRVHSARIRASL